MGQRLTFSSKLKVNYRRRSESESEQGVQSVGVDPKADDLLMARLKVG